MNLRPDCTFKAGDFWVRKSFISASTTCSGLLCSKVAAESSYPAEIGFLFSVRQVAKPQDLGNLLVDCRPCFPVFSFYGACSAIVYRRYEDFCFPFLILRTVSAALLTV